MRKLIMFSVFAFAFTACSNVAQYKDAIDTLSTDWESTTAKVTAMVEQISQTQTMAKSALDAMAPSEEITAQMSEEQTGVLNGLKEQLSGQLGSIGDLSKTAFEFVNKWQSEGENLKALTDGLTAGKLPEDPQGMIDSLTGLVGEGNTNVESWGEQVNTIKEAVASASASYSSLISSFTEE
jgi:chromosome segregation ATPase